LLLSCYGSQISDIKKTSTDKTPFPRHIMQTSVSTGEFNPYSYEPNQFVESYQNFKEDVASGLFNISPVKVNKRLNLKAGEFTVAAVQLETTPPIQDSTNGSQAHHFYEKAVKSIESAVENHGASLVLLQELFLGPYFCQSQDSCLFSLAESDIDVYENDGTNSKNSIISNMQALAKNLGVVLPISIFERKNNVFFNCVVMIDADGTNLGTYRKSHIPDGTGYQEKFYFSPGDTGFKVFSTKVGKIGVGICWDQWFPEAARSMALMGADVLLYPTAIGSEPQDQTLDSSDHWQRVMQGHAAANIVPVVASNRFGTEFLLNKNGEVQQQIKFYGRSFITDEKGVIVKEAKDGSDTISTTVNAEKNRAARAAWGVFRDRRPELYGLLRTKDGSLPIH